MEYKHVRLFAGQCCQNTSTVRGPKHVPRLCTAIQAHVIMVGNITPSARDHMNALRLGLTFLCSDGTISDTLLEDSNGVVAVGRT